MSEHWLTCQSVSLPMCPFVVSYFDFKAEKLSEAEMLSFICSYTVPRSAKRDSLSLEKCDSNLL